MPPPWPFLLLKVKKWKCYLVSHVLTFWDPLDYTSVHGFSGQGCWSELPFHSQGDLPNPGIKPESLELQVDSLPSELPGKPFYFFFPLLGEVNWSWPSHTSGSPNCMVMFEEGDSSFCEWSDNAVPLKTERQISRLCCLWHGYVRVHLQTYMPGTIYTSRRMDRGPMQLTAFRLSI